MQQDRHLSSVIQAATNTERLWTQYQSQFKEDTVEPSVPAQDFNHKAYATKNVTEVIRRDWALNTGLACRSA